MDNKWNKRNYNNYNNFKIKILNNNFNSKTICKIINNGNIFFYKTN